MNFKFPFLVTIFSVALLARAVEPQGGFFDITDENDTWSNILGKHQDRHYTHGTKLTLMFSEHSITNLLVPLWGIHDAVACHGIAVGQSMFTPEDILDPEPIPGDRPYAGWLYAGLVYQRRGQLTTNCAVMENFELNAGVVGPWSMADRTQRMIHRWRFPEDIPQGWHNQLKNEPGIVLKYARLWRWSPTPETAKFFDIIPRAGVELGNVAIFATAGATVRLGLNLPPDFGMQVIDSPASNNGGRFTTRHSSIYLFASADGRYVAHDITLDGNSFRDGPRVDKFNWVDDLTWGCAVQPCRYFEIRYAHVTRSRQFRGQRGNDVFGSLDACFTFNF